MLYGYILYFFWSDLYVYYLCNANQKRNRLVSDMGKNMYLELINEQKKSDAGAKNIFNIPTFSAHVKSRFLN